MGKDPGPADEADPADLFLQSLESLGPLGRGGMSEVRRVRDARLDRTMALKVIDARLTDSADELRFITEAQVEAQLQHPGVVPIYALGRLADGRAAYAMQEVHGDTLRSVISEVHAEARGGAWQPTASGWSLRRLVGALHRATEVVAYAHSRGVLHRDLKPQNIMVGAFGEVFVLDWGLARVRSAELGQSSLRTELARRAEGLTQYGSVNGTPAYMSPEQARGALDQMGPQSDVFSLGAVLFEILTGIPPYKGRTVYEVLLHALLRELEPLEGPAPLPPELVAICEHALAAEPDQRPRDAGALATALEDWLDGAHRRDQALAEVAEADALLPEIAAMRAEAEAAAAQAAATLSTLQPHSPVSDKLPAWELEDRAALLRREADLRGVDYTQRLHAALNLFPELPEARDRLAEHYRHLQEDAEARRDEGGAARAEALLRAYDRGQHAAWLRGDGALDLVTDPEGAEVALYRYARVERRLVPVFERNLGRTPLIGAPLGQGSWLLEIHAEGRAPARYPVQIPRAGRWDGVAPGGVAPEPIPLLRADALGPDEVYVPAGWCRVGGDEEAGDAQPAARIWIDGFVIQRFPITFAEYLTFLDALEAEEGDEQARARAPRRAGVETILLASRGASGRWEPGLNPRGRRFELDWPVSNISAEDALAYAAWRARLDGLPWRLPHELEREKAGRGVDGRHFPWGDAFDATWCCLLPSHKGLPFPSAVTAWPTDESPYGARGLAGGLTDWCGSAYRRRGWSEGRLHPAAEVLEAGALRSARGGWWSGQPVQARLASRTAGGSRLTFDAVGFRLARSIP